MTAIPRNSGALASTPEALLDRVTAAWKDRPGSVLGVLEELQTANPHNFLPADTVRQAAQALGIPLSQALGVVTFYAFFNRKPQGKHLLAICRGTACHTRGSRHLLDAVCANVAFAPDAQAQDSETLVRTTADNQMTLRTVACFGQCALAPVVEIDRSIHGRVNRQQLMDAVSQFKKEGVRP